VTRPGSPTGFQPLAVAKEQIIAPENSSTGTESDVTSLPKNWRVLFMRHWSAAPAPKIATSSPSSRCSSSTIRWPLVVMLSGRAMQNLAGRPVSPALARVIACRHAAAQSVLALRPSPALMVMLSEPNRIRLTESSQKPWTDETSPSVVQPISSSPGHRSARPASRASWSMSMAANRMPACGARPASWPASWRSRSSRTAGASKSSLCATATKNIGTPLPDIHPSSSPGAAR
jgi:hypothetical protein